jgi:ApaG protein
VISATTEGIRVSVESFYLPDRSNPENQQFVFAYRITIQNGSDRTVQLLRRHWFVTSADDEVTEVTGDGVVGEQPVLKPGEEHTYVSGTILETPTGSMEGHYEMEDPAGNVFRVEIPLFILGTRETLH